LSAQVVPSKADDVLADAMSGSALYSAIPVLKEKLGFSTVEAVWLISAFSLTFASFLLLSGRMSDVFDPSACARSG
jgi:MFS family permease